MIIKSILMLTDIKKSYNISLRTTIWLVLFGVLQGDMVFPSLFSFIRGFC